MENEGRITSGGTRVEFVISPAKNKLISTSQRISGTDLNIDDPNP